MLYGRPTISKITPTSIDLKCRKEKVTVKEGDKIQCLIDPFEDDHYASAHLYMMDFDEFVSNINIDEEEFIDDLMYICGLGID